MKILREVAQKNVPSTRTGRQRNTEHDDLASKIANLKPGKVLPVECEDEREVTNLVGAIRRRVKNVRAEVRDNTVYFSLKG
jgi:hypothetical protein